MKLKKGDSVIVISGKDKGVKGKIIRVLPAEERIVVEKVNLVKRHQKPTRNFPGGIVERPASLASSKVILVCSRCGKPTRVGRGTLPEGVKVRMCKRCKEVIDRG